MTKREQVWRCIRQAGEPIGPAEIAARLGMSVKNVGGCLLALKVYNKLIIEGKARRTTYAIPKNARYKNPGKGNHPNSRRELVQWDWRKGLEKIRERQCPGKPMPHEPKGLHILDECWGSMKTCR